MARSPHGSPVLAQSLPSATIRKQSGEDWSAPYSGRGADSTNRFGIVIDCAAHADHHISLANLGAGLPLSATSQGFGPASLAVTILATLNESDRHEQS